MSAPTSTCALRRCGDRADLAVGRRPPSLGRDVVGVDDASAARPRGASWIAATRSRRRRTRSTRSSRVSGSPRRCVCTRRSPRKRPSAARRRPMSGSISLRRVADDDVVDLARAVDERADLAARLERGLARATMQLGRRDVLERDPAPVDALERLRRVRAEPGGVSVEGRHSREDPCPRPSFIMHRGLSRYARPVMAILTPVDLPAAQTIRRALRPPCRGVRGILAGSVNTNVELSLAGPVSRAFLRVYEEQTTATASREARLLDHLAARDVLTPRPLSRLDDGAFDRRSPRQAGRPFPLARRRNPLPGPRDRSGLRTRRRGPRARARRRLLVRRRRAEPLRRRSPRAPPRGSPAPAICQLRSRKRSSASDVRSTSASRRAPRSPMPRSFTAISSATTCSGRRARSPRCSTSRARRAALRRSISMVTALAGASATRSSRRSFARCFAAIPRCERSRPRIARRSSRRRASLRSASASPGSPTSSSGLAGAASTRTIAASSRASTRSTRSAPPVFQRSCRRRSSFARILRFFTPRSVAWPPPCRYLPEMAQVGSLDFKGFVENRKGQRAGGSVDGGHAYSYVSDRHTRAAFEKMKPVELAVTAAVRLFKSVGKNQLLGHAVKVGPNAVPAHPQPRPAAAPRRSGSRRRTIYIVNDPRAERRDLRHQRRLVHHDPLGARRPLHRRRAPERHRPRVRPHPQLHVVYLTAMHYLKTMASIFVALDCRSRRSSRSPAGRAAPRSPATAPACSAAKSRRRRDARAREARPRIAQALRRVQPRSVPRAVRRGQRRRRQVRGGHSRRHPWLPKRVLAMRVFAESELYRKHVGLGDGGAHDGRGRRPGPRRHQERRLNGTKARIRCSKRFREQEDAMSPRRSRELGDARRDASARRPRRRGSNVDLVHEARGGSLPPRRRGRVQPRQDHVRERAPRRDRRCPWA